jgi:hypothetical protein
MALDCESRAKESRSVARSGDKSRNDCPINMVEYGSESSNDDEADMCVAEWSWASKSISFVCSSLKSTSKSRQDEIRFTFNVTKCDKIFDYLLQEKQIKLSSNHVILSLEQLKKHMHIINSIIPILMLLMITIFCHKQKTIEVCEESPNKARQRSVPG